MVVSGVKGRWWGKRKLWDFSSMLKYVIKKKMLVFINSGLACGCLLY